MTHLGGSSSHGLDLDVTLISRAASLASDSSIQNCTFACADFMRSPSSFFSTLSLADNQALSDSSAHFDTILLFSITKWLHLHHGDLGLRALFRALHDYLVQHVDGTLVVEPQEWDNYKKASDKNKALKPMFRTLEMRPPFVEELRETGFVLLETIEREEGGFSRPLLVWRAQAKT